MKYIQFEHKKRICPGLIEMVDLGVDKVSCASSVCCKIPRYNLLLALFLFMAV